MKKETLVSGKYKFGQVSYLNQSGTWHFSFNDGLAITLECFWRLFSENGIVWTSNDHNQIYGLPNPIDLQKEFFALLNLQELLRIERVEKTGDLSIEFTNGYYLEAYTDSSGYECWQIQYQGSRYVGMGQGEFVRYE